MDPLRGFRYLCELVTGGLAGAALIATLFSADWIEEMTGFEPDHGTGALEWTIVLVLAAITAASSVLRARGTRRAFAGSLSPQALDEQSGRKF